MTPLDWRSPITTVIFLSLMLARQGVESWSAMRSWRASFSARSESSCCENLKPCPTARPVVSRAIVAAVAKARVDRINFAGQKVGAPLSRQSGRLAQQGPEIHMEYSTAVLALQLPGATCGR